MDGGKVKANPQMSATLNTFAQIMDILNFDGSLNTSDGEKTSNIAQDLPEKSVGDKQKAGQLSTEEWNQLDSLLSIFVSGLQQPPAIEVPKEIDSQSSAAQMNPIMGVLNQVQGDQMHPDNQLLQMLQKLSGFDQNNVSDPSQLVQSMTEVINKLETDENQTTVETPILQNIIGKLQTIVDELKNANINTNQMVTLMPPENKSANTNENFLNTQLSLDKNQLFVSSVPSTPYYERAAEGSFTKQHTVSSAKKEDLSEADELPLTVNNLSMNPINTGTAVKAESLIGSIHVSDFVPEISDWINNNIRITNGPSGTAEAKFSLFPEHLGHIEISITSDQGQISARILTDTSLTKDVLEGQLSNLKQALQQHGLVVQKLDIVQQGSMSADSSQSTLSFAQGDSNASRDQRNYTMVNDHAKKRKDADAFDLEKEISAITYGGSGSNLKSKLIDFTA